MNILDQIILRKKEEVRSLRQALPESELLRSSNINRKVLSISEALTRTGSSGIIAEFKRKSPSKGYINRNADIEQITRTYTENGAAALSVLTDTEFFGAEKNDLLISRTNNIPILRKEFIIDPYQVIHSKYLGADAVLLIAACLSVSQLSELASCAGELGLEIIIEIHNEDELGHICPEAQLIGINNRDLKTFSVDISRSVELRRQIPMDYIPVAESGIGHPGTVKLLREQGFKGFLIGEAFMRSNHPGTELKNFIEQLN